MNCWTLDKGKMIGRRKIYDGKIGDDGTEVPVWEHCDHEGEMNLSVSAVAIKETNEKPRNSDSTQDLQTGKADTRLLHAGDRRPRAEKD
jgi:hypothetical protein